MLRRLKHEEVFDRIWRCCSCGFDAGQYCRWEEPLTDVQEVTVTCVVRPGDTLWNIAEGFYGHGISAEDYNAFQYRISQDNKELFADGRQLQVGDKVKIRYYTKR